MSRKAASSKEATAGAIVDGWYWAGDLGSLDEYGWLRLSGRSKEMIEVRGFQVAPAEVDTILFGDPAVGDCAVFGVAGRDGGETVIAAVRADLPVAAHELVGLVGDQLAAYKVPARLVFVDEIPRLPSGKVLRRVLAERYGSS